MRGIFRFERDGVRDVDCNCPAGAATASHGVAQTTASAIANWPQFKSDNFHTDTTRSKRRLPLATSRTLSSNGATRRARTA